jgi:Double zinc ribbon
MDELDRLFRQLVRALAAVDRARLTEPMQVAELYQDLLPYRAYRGALRFETYQDYEMALLRLLGGERGYARVEPAEAQAALELEAQAAYPDAGTIREFAAARVYLDAAAANKVLASDDAYAPAALHPPTPPRPAAAAERAARPEHAARPAGIPGPAAANTAEERPPRRAALNPGEPCPYCGADLPDGRTIFYCPFCGGNVRGVLCPDCRTELEVGWTFCITCGRKMGKE